MNMREWSGAIMASGMRAIFPFMPAVGLRLEGLGMRAALSDASLQARCVAAAARRFPATAAVSFMDLSVEAEAFGARTVQMGEETPTVTGSLVTDMGTAAALRAPVIGAGRTGLYLEAARLASRALRDRPVFGCLIGPFSLAGRLCGMTEALMNIHCDPELLHVVLDKCTGFLVEYAGAFRDTGVNGVVLAEPAAGLISPAQCLEFSSSYIERIVRAIQADDFMVVLHNCGATHRHLPAMLSTGARALHFGNAADMAGVMPQVPPGILALGNIDPAGVLHDGTPETVREAAMRLLRSTARYPNFVLSSGCDVPAATPLGNIDALFRTMAEYNGAARVSHVEGGNQYAL